MYNYIVNNKITNVLDFGCGSGILSYLLSKIGIKVTAIDIDLSPYKLLSNYLSFPKEITFYEGSISDLWVNFRNSIDCIIALDVLEHIEDINEIVEIFKKCLTVDGKCIILGPTENTIYKIGRKIAGKQYSGDYHKSDIYKIEGFFRENYQINDLHTIFKLIPIFKILEVKLT